MNMQNLKVLIKPDETIQDIIAEICDDCNVGLDEPFAFSAIMVPDKKDKGYYNLRINRIVPAKENPYNVEELIYTLMTQKGLSNGLRYVQPPIEQWLTSFKPLLMTIVNDVHSQYELLIPSREEMESILYLTVMKLYVKGYYLHRTLIKKSYINELNLECRKLKNLPITDSLDAPITYFEGDDADKPLTLLDQIIDQESTDWANENRSYTNKDYWQDMFEHIKRRMLRDMSELQFDRILLQLRTHTVDRSTSHYLNRYREIFNPGYTPRPNSKGKPKGGNRHDK